MDIAASLSSLIYRALYGHPLAFGPQLGISAILELLLNNDNPLLQFFVDDSCPQQFTPS